MLTRLISLSISVTRITITSKTWDLFTLLGWNPSRESYGMKIQPVVERQLTVEKSRQKSLLGKIRRISIVRSTSSFGCEFFPFVSHWSVTLWWKHRRTNQVNENDFQKIKFSALTWDHDNIIHDLKWERKFLFSGNHFLVSMLRLTIGHFRY